VNKTAILFTGIFLNKESVQTFHHSYASTPVKGIYRDKLFEDAKENGIARAYANVINNHNVEEVEHKNMSSVVSPYVLRNIVSQKTSQNYLLNDFKQKVEMRQLNDYDPLNVYSGLVRNVMSEPFSVYMYIESQLKNVVNELEKSSDNKPLLFSVDTSGDLLPQLRGPVGKIKLYNFGIHMTCISGNGVKNGVNYFYVVTLFTVASLCYIFTVAYF